MFVRLVVENGGRNEHEPEGRGRLHVCPPTTSPALSRLVVLDRPAPLSPLRLAPPPTALHLALSPCLPRPLAWSAEVDAAPVATGQAGPQPRPPGDRGRQRRGGPVVPLDRLLQVQGLDRGRRTAREHLVEVRLSCRRSVETRLVGSTERSCLFIPLVPPSDPARLLDVPLWSLRAALLATGDAVRCSISPSPP